MLSSGEGFGPDHVGVSEIGRQDLKPGAIVPDPGPVDADAVHCHLLAGRSVRGPIDDGSGFLRGWFC